MGHRKCPDCISRNQAEILAGLARGEKYGTIANRLFMTASTVSYHVARLQSRLSVPNRAALVAIAVVAGVLSPDQWPMEISGVLHLAVDSECADGGSSTCT